MKKVFVLSALLTVLLCALLACGGSSTSNTSTDVTGNAPTQVPVLSKHFKIGQTVGVGNTWQVTVQSVKKVASSSGGAITPKAGNTFVEITIAMKNISAKEQNVSSILQFNLAGDDGTKYTEALNTDVPNPPDGKVEAGMPIKGTFTYEVPTTMKKLTFSFENDIISSGQAIWDIAI